MNKKVVPFPRRAVGYDDRERASIEKLGEINLWIKILQKVETEFYNVGTSGDSFPFFQEHPVDGGRGETGAEQCARKGVCP